MDSIHKEIKLNLKGYPVKYPWQSILEESQGPSSFSFMVHNVSQKISNLHFGASCQSTRPRCPSLIIGYQRKLQDILLHFQASQQGLGLGVDFGNAYSGLKRESGQLNEVQPAILHPFTALIHDRLNPSGKFLFKLGLIVGKPTTELVLLYLNNHNFTGDVPEGKTLQSKVHLEHLKRKLVFDIGTTFDVSSPFMLAERTDPFPFRIIQTDFLAGKYVNPKWLIQLGATYQKEGLCDKKQGFIALTYKPKNYLTLATRGGTIFSDRQTQVNAAFGARYRCCEKFNVFGSVHLDDLITFGLKSKNFLHGLSFSVKGKLGLLDILQKKRKKESVLKWKMSYESKD